MTLEELKVEFIKRRKAIEEKYPYEDYEGMGLDYRDSIMRAEVSEVNKWLKEKLELLPEIK